MKPDLETRSMKPLTPIWDMQSSIQDHDARILILNTCDPNRDTSFDTRGHDTRSTYSRSNLDTKTVILGSSYSTHDDTQIVILIL